MEKQFGNILGRIIFIGLFILCGGCIHAPDEISPSGSLTHVDLQNLIYSKNKIQSGDAAYVSVFDKLIKEADKALTEGPFSVMNKTRVPPSGDKHDYLSLAPYWWPDETKPDGLPWIRRDGEVNPMTRGDNVDQPTKSHFFENVKTLSLAYYFSDKKLYADKTVELLYTWFVNPETKMNPNLNYAQGVPGVNDGREFGVIEFTSMLDAITAIEILELKEVIKPDTVKAIRKWMTDYLTWLQTSELGTREGNTLNNHGTWYDVQVLSLQLFLNTKEAARNTSEAVKKRIDSQIEADGSQPHELSRTKSMSYSTMNLAAFTQLAFLSEKAGVDLWNYKNPKGSGLQKAYDYLYPFAVGESDWQYKQLGSMDEATAHLRELFKKTGSMFNVNGYCQMGKNTTPSLTHPCRVP